MVKILAIGDFHGKFPSKLMKKIKKQDFDLILSPGDYCGNEELSKLFFKYVYGTEHELSEFIGKKKANELERKSFDAGVKVLKKLNSLGKPIIGIRGNWDPTNWVDIGHPIIRDHYTKRFNSKIKRLKNIKIIDFKNYRILGFNFAGYPSSTYPGKITKYIEGRMKKRFEKNAAKVINRIKQDNKKYFKKFKEKFDNNTVFITHNCPNNTRLDILKRGPQKGKHYGSYLARKIISGLHPKLALCGHMHENRGKQMLGKTLMVNPGTAKEGKAAIIELDARTKKVLRVKFIK
jgi:Icc-related predicted phosphoesterase